MCASLRLHSCALVFLCCFPLLFGLMLIRGAWSWGEVATLLTIVSTAHTCSRGNEAVSRSFSVSSPYPLLIFYGRGPTNRFHARLMTWRERMLFFFADDCARPVWPGAMRGCADAGSDDRRCHLCRVLLLSFCASEQTVAAGRRRVRDDVENGLRWGSYGRDG